MKVIVTILSAALLFSLSACGGSSGGSSGDNSTGSSTSQNQSQTDKATKSTDKSSTSSNSKSNNATSNNSNTSGSNGTTTNQSTGSTNRENLIHPKNIKDINGFVQDKNQSFAVNLNSWGNVEFVSGKITSGNHIPTVFYLTNKNGDILHDFSDSPFPYNVDVKAVSFEDVNKDGLKDIIVIVTQNDNNGNPIAALWLQHANKTFTCDQSVTGKGDINSVRDYFSKKY